MIEFVTNRDRSHTHFHRLSTLLQNADEVYIAVAFLKMSGIRALLPYFGKNIRFRIIAGTNYGITEPNALNVIHEYAQKTDVKGYLNSLKSRTVFHPKMYLIKEGRNGHILIGSANLTNGGLEANHECSIYHKCRIEDKVWNDAVGQFNDSILPENADLLSDRVISIYRDYYKHQKKINESIQQFPDVSDNLLYDLARLKTYFEKLNKQEMPKELAEKRNHYLEARKILEQIRTKQLSSRQFNSLLEELVGKKGQLGYWYSNGMFRLKGNIFQHQKEFTELVTNIKSNLNKTPAAIYNEAKRISEKIKGVGPNFIGEIMMSYAPQKLANINRNPITVLREEGKVDIKSHSQSFTGKDYQEYNNIVQEIGFKLGLKDMLETDYFFNNIYQQIKADLKNKGLRK